MRRGSKTPRRCDAKSKRSRSRSAEQGALVECRKQNSDEVGQYGVRLEVEEMVFTTSLQALCRSEGRNDWSDGYARRRGVSQQR